MIRVNNNKKIRHDIQYLRAISVLAVVAYHGNSDVFLAGYLGVDVFIFISGFVLAPHLIKLISAANYNEFKKGLKIFLLSRIIRLYPALLFFIIICTPIILLLLPTGEALSATLKQGFFAIFSLANVSADQLEIDYFNPSPNPYLHLWSLGVEWQIQIIVLILIYGLVVTRKKFTSNLFIFITISTLVFISYVSLINLDRSSDQYYNSIYRLWEFLFGIIVFKLSTKINFSFPNLIKYTIFIIMLLILMYPGRTLNIIQFPAIILILVPFLLSKDIPIKHDRILHYIGSRSYSIYLYHLVFFVIAKHSTLDFFLGFDDRSIYTIVALPATLFFAEISFQKFEKLSINYSKLNVLLYLFICTACFLGAINFLNSNKFFNFNNLAQQPIFAGNLDKDCDRTSVTSHPCRYGNFLSPYSINLIGDSHAAALSQAVIQAGKELSINVNIWSYKGCKYADPLVLEADQIKLYSLNSEGNCQLRDESFRNWVFGNPGSIVIGTWRSQDCEINEFLGRCGSEFTSTQMNSFIKLSQKTLGTIIVTPVPEFKDDRFFAPRSLIQREYIASSFVPKFEMNGQSFKDEIQILNNNLRGIKVIESSKLFCLKTECFRKNNNNWIYRDTNHLSAYGASLLTPVLKKYTLDVINFVK
jgi:peptidoglycan/LPS O-acetylase OafA/YrhL